MRCQPNSKVLGLRKLTSNKIPSKARKVKPWKLDTSTTLGNANKASPRVKAPSRSNKTGPRRRPALKQSHKGKAKVGVPETKPSSHKWKKNIRQHKHLKVSALAWPSTKSCRPK